MANVLEVKNLQKSFKRNPWSKPKKVLHNISFGLTQGVMTGFLGINGSGKTTTIKCALDLITPDSGEILFFGENISRNIKKRIGFLPEKPQLYDHLTGGEFLEFAMKLSRSEVSSSKINMQKKIDEILELVDLDNAKYFRLREYSKGMYQRMGLAQAIARNPDLMILDEPMSDLDPAGRSLEKDILKRIQTEKKVSVFISSHLLQDIESLCPEIVILNEGEVKYTGPTLSFINKLNPNFEITYENQNKFHTVSVDSEAKLQAEIDKLRNQKMNIITIQNQKSLEEAFKNFIQGF
jgi:ABC-2 type transport system ATP-binding protein